MLTLMKGDKGVNTSKAICNFSLFIELRNLHNNVSNLLQT